MIGLHLDGFNNSEIARNLTSVSSSCALRTIQKFNLTSNTADKKRSERPSATSIVDCNSIYRIARQNPEYLAQEINPTSDNISNIS